MTSESKAIRIGLENKEGLFITLNIETSYFFLLDRGTNQSIWPIQSSLTKMKLSRRQARDEQWKKHFQVCGLNELHDLLVADYNQITKEFILNKFPKYKVDSIVNGDEELYDYNITQQQTESSENNCSIHLFEKINSSITVGDASAWGGGAKTLKFKEVNDTKWESHFETCGVIKLFKFLKINHDSLTRLQLLKELSKMGYIK